MSEQRLQETMERARAAWSERWRSEAPEVPPRKLHYEIEFECTQETWESVRQALAGFPLTNKHAHVREI